MDEVRIVRQRTHIWPVIIALIVLALVIAYVFFSTNGPASQVGQVGGHGPSTVVAMSLPTDSSHR